MQQKQDIAAIIVAAGSGSRASGISSSDLPKQFRLVQGRPMMRHSYAALVQHPAITQVIVVIGAGQEALAKAALEGLPEATFVIGGATRRDSVRHALEALAAKPPEKVLIHDAARPFLSARVIDDLIAALSEKPAAIPALPVVDSLARGNSIMGETVEREQLWRIQTPQAFRYDAILHAHRTWDASQDATDDARMAMAAGHDVAIIAGDERLTKFTFAEDFSEHEENKMANPAFRSGTGFDVHKLVKGEELWLCGIKIEHHSGLLGHSDADVAMHALTDAILGALALGDIGDHFPPSDPKWRGASSDQFLAYAMELARGKGYALANADLTIICEAPKIGGHRLAMRQRLAEIMMADIDQISVKATTTERLGFTGRGEGIAAQAIATFTRVGI
jgi:2-C-methyl-D-erythritol 4-phosphate cytidylyltransferase / 2-C-methyl-D-erythritol 2,4-cyclodiphosphate synthase